MFVSARRVGLAPRTFLNGTRMPTSCVRNNSRTLFTSSGPKGPKKNRLRSLFYGGMALGIGYGVGWGFKATQVENKKKLNNQKLLEYEGSKESDKELEKVPEYKYLHNHPVVQKLRNDPNYIESRYYDVIPDEHQENMLTAGLLAGQGYITVEPLVFTHTNKQDVIYLYHVGDKLSAHEEQGIIHRGFLATLMDEGLSRCSFASLPNQYGVTAKLDLKYKAPVPSQSYLLLHAHVTEAKGRRVKAEGNLHTLEANKKAETVLVEGSVVMVEPRWAKYLLWLFN